MTKYEDFKKIEKHLKKYNSYKTSVKNMEKSLNVMFPRITSVMEPREGTTGTFTNKSDTEEYAIKRIEKKDKLKYKISQLNLIIDSIDSGLKQLEPLEREFVEMHYINKVNMKKVAPTFGYSLRTLYTIRDDVKEELLITLHNLIDIEI